MIESRIDDLKKKIDIAKREDINDIIEFGLEHRMQELIDLHNDINGQRNGFSQ